MPAARLPIDEPQRLQLLHRMGILDSGPDLRLDRITANALALFPGASIAAVSLVDTDRQCFKSRMGLETDQTTRSISFCAHAILGNRVLVVPDATLDARFADLGLVTSASAIRFYAGAPLKDSLGSLCVMDTVPRQASAEAILALAKLARAVDAHLIIKAALRALGSQQVSAG